MASDFNDLRADLERDACAQQSGNILFLVMVITVVAIGGVVGYFTLPRGGDAALPQANQMESASAQISVSNSELRAARRVALNQYRETQVKLLNCARSQRHMQAVYKTYSDRNLPHYQAWHRLFDPAKMNAAEAMAFMATGRNESVRQAIEDIEMDLAATQVKIDPIECGQLNSQVQRRALDLSPPPTL